VVFGEQTKLRLIAQSIRLKLANMNTVQFLQFTHLWRTAQRLKNNLLKSRRLRFYSQFVKEGDLCFDVGANIGNRTEIFLRLGAKVVAVEPQKEPFNILVKRYGKNKNFTGVNKGLDSKDQMAEIHLCSVDGVSSMSKEWIARVKEKGRFPKEYDWEKAVTVPVTTLDALIKSYGVPAFCKVDVEGYEYQVIQGLSSPIQFMAFEYTQEFIDSTLSVVNYLERLGSYEYNYVEGENTHLALPNWVRHKKILDLLNSLRDHNLSNGDLYCRLTRAKSVEVPINDLQHL